MTGWREAVRRAIHQRRPSVFTAHYACEDWRLLPSGHTPRITTIALRDVVHGLTRVYSLALTAERHKLSIAQIDQHLDELEREVLREFGCQLQRLQEHRTRAWWFHWAMRDATFGWPVLEHRFRTMLGEQLTLPEDHLIDLHEVLAHEHGADFVPRPRFLELANCNGLHSSEMLSGSDEAVAWCRRDFQRLSRSTARKAEALGHLLLRYVGGELITNRRTQTIRKQDKRPAKQERNIENATQVEAAHAARLCGISRATWYRLHAAGKVPKPNKLGRRTLWNIGELRAWIDAKCPNPLAWQCQSE